MLRQDNRGLVLYDASPAEPTTGQANIVTQGPSSAPLNQPLQVSTGERPTEFKGRTGAPSSNKAFAFAAGGAATLVIAGLVLYMCMYYKSSRLVSNAGTAGMMKAEGERSEAKTSPKGSTSVSTTHKSLSSTRTKEEETKKAEVEVGTSSKGNTEPNLTIPERIFVEQTPRIVSPNQTRQNNASIDPIQKPNPFCVLSALFGETTSSVVSATRSATSLEHISVVLQDQPAEGDQSAVPSATFDPSVKVKVKMCGDGWIRTDDTSDTNDESSEDISASRPTSVQIPHSWKPRDAENTTEGPSVLEA